MDLQKAEEFRSNLLLLLQCGYPEGLPISQLKSEYKQYFSEDVGPETILPRGFKNSKHWDALFQLKEFKEDFTLFYMGPVVYVKAIRRRSHSDLKFIAQLAKHSHLQLAKKAEFQCGCCTPDFWKGVAREAAVEPAYKFNPASGRDLTQGQPEDIVVKIEPGLMNNGEDDDSTSGGGGLHFLDPQQGNHQQHVSSFANGGNGGVLHPDPSGSSASNMSSNTNDGFMLDHQLRVQQNANSQSQLQAFASLLNSSAGQQTNADGSVAPQPFYTFLLQNGELKVMQVVSSQSENGDANTSPGASASGSSGTSANPIQSSIPPHFDLSDIVDLGFLCTTPGCGQKFDEKQLLQNHERTCAFKKYPCTHAGCDRRFKNSKQRHAHVTSRHKGSENPFRCCVPECTAFFKTADRLKVHESRCKFKYEQFQMMEVEELASNNNNRNFMMSNHSSVPGLNFSTDPTSTSNSGPNTAFTSLQAASIMSDVNSVSIPGIHIPDGSQANNETVNMATSQRNSDKGFSTVDLSLVKSEVMESIT